LLADKERSNNTDAAGKRVPLGDKDARFERSFR
jgi:hypothetical protein